MRDMDTASVLRNAARTIAVLTALIWTLFAFVSGAENGMAGLISNLPNILPWLALLIATYVAFRSELLGGALLIMLGTASIVFFHAWTVPIVLFGL
jgi:hypothetical protein